MQKREIFKKIGGIITELNDQYQYLSQNPESLNDLELELFLANSNFLADHIEILRKLNNIPSQAVNEHYSKPEPVQEIPVDHSSTEIVPVVAKTELPPIFTFVEEEETAFDYEQKPVGELFDRQLSPEEQAIIDSKKATITENVTEAPITPVSTVSEVIPLPPQETVVETKEPEIVVQVQEPVTATHKATINELISSQVASTTMASRFNQNSVSDLKAIISLNDKLLFIKDLFNGYSLAYSEAIELVNRYDSFESADNFLKHNYAVKNKWESKPETVEKFYELLNRRFA